MVKTLLIILLPALIAYGYSLTFGFSQDDFIFLYSSRANSLSEFLNFFNPYAQFPDIFHFRPLSTQVYFFLNQSTFGLNPLPFRIEALALHLANTILFYFVILKIWQNQKVATLSALLFGISSVHFLSLFYIGAFQEILRTFFIFLSLLALFKYLDQQKKLFLFFLLFSFLGAILAKETSIIFPLAILPIELIRKGRSIKETLKSVFIPITLFILLASVVMIIRIDGLRQVFNQGYQLTTNPWEMLQNLKWYLVWAFGLPEILSSYPSLKPSSILQFIKDYKLAPVIILSLLIFVLSLVPSLAKLRPNLKTFALVAIFTIFILPALPLFEHRYPHYLDLSLIAILPPLVLIILKKKVGVICLVSFIILQLSSIFLSANIHWTTHRSEVADYYKEYLSKNYQNQTTVIFVGSDKSTSELSVSLAKDYALKVWYKDIKEVIYTTDTSKISTSDTMVVPITVY